MIAAAAATILAAASAQPNPAAQARGLGPCQIAATGSVENRGRPTHSMTIPAGSSTTGEAVQFQPAAYHITWCAANRQPPPAQPGLHYSHLCNNKRCVEARHGVWEGAGVNADRERCRAGAACAHVPRCLV
jgi:hypothetical protein